MGAGIRITRIGVKMTLLFVMFALILCLTVSLFSYFASYDAYSDFYSQKAQETAALAATFIDGDRIAQYLITGETDEYYERLHAILSDIKREQNVMYLYVFAPEMDRFTYILEVSLDSDDPELIAHMGDVFEYTELEYTYLAPDIANKRASTEKVIAYDTAGFGQAVEAWAPIFDSGGALVAMVEADMSLDLVMDMLGNYIFTVIIISSAIILVMVLLLALFNRRIVTRPLKKLTQNALELASGDALGSVDDIVTGDEMQTLNEALKKMAGDIERYSSHLASVAADKERIQTQLNVAVDIRKSLLPKPFEADKAFSVGALLNSAREVGGDFYDYFYIDDNRVCLTVANVSGSGIPAALFMVVAKTVIKNQMLTKMPVEEAMGLVNTRLFESNSGNMTVAAFVGVLEKDTGVFSYVNAGGEAPFILRKGGGFSALSGQTASVLAENRNVEYRRMELTLRQGDKLFLFTRGVPAWKNAAGRELGAENLLELLNSSHPSGKTAQELLNSVHKELLVIAEDYQSVSDSTMLLMTYDKGDRALAELSVPPRADSLKRVLPFIKSQLYENGLGGPFYASVAIALEELFVIAIGRVSGGELITIRCAVRASRVEITLFYGGLPENPLESAASAERDAFSFIRKNTDELSYSVNDGKNSLTVVKSRSL